MAGVSGTASRKINENQTAWRGDNEGRRRKSGVGGINGVSAAWRVGAAYREKRRNQRRGGDNVENIIKRKYGEIT